MFHLHVVVDDEIQKGIEAHARLLEGGAATTDRLNVSAAVRDLLRLQLGLQRVDAA